MSSSYRIVRCKRGHLFTTKWVWGVSFKAVRWGLHRFQRCPVGGHWSWVEWVDEHELTEGERTQARSRRDTWIP